MKADKVLSHQEIYCKNYSGNFRSLGRSESQWVVLPVQVQEFDFLTVDQIDTAYVIRGMIQFIDDHDAVRDNSEYVPTLQRSCHPYGISWFSLFILASLVAWSGSVPEA